jgi:hypothetical protein
MILKFSSAILVKDTFSFFMLLTNNLVNHSGFLLSMAFVTSESP